MTDLTSFNYVSEIWNIADYVRDEIRPADYNKLILPFALLRRLECSLEATRDDVCKAVEQFSNTLGLENDYYKSISKKPFYNVTSFRLNDLGVNRTLEALMQYIDGFSANAREILNKFKIRDTCSDLNKKGMLYEVCMRFSKFDLSPETVSDRMMSDIYEHLIQRYGEEIAQDAEDFMTPKDIVRLAVKLLFANEDSFLNSNNGSVRRIYDGTCGTCGFLSDALDLINEWADIKKLDNPPHLIPYGQECEGVTWAIGKTNLLLRNIGNQEADKYEALTDVSAFIKEGNTLSEDKFPNETFNYQVANPPYGKKWENVERQVRDEAALGFKGRFGAGLPDIGDGSLLFVQNVASKLAPPEKGGGKAAIVLSGSPLFTGDAGSGPSNIRRWLFEKDLVDCIVKLPSSIFFRTSISTYIWILSNKKPDNRKGFIQLIDASEEKTLLKRNLGNKRFEISDKQADWIVRTYVDGHDHGKSVIVPVTDFMYRQYTTQRPLRIRFDISFDKIKDFLSVSKIQKTSATNKKTFENVVKSLDGKSLTYVQINNEINNIHKDLEKPKVPKKDILSAFITAYGIRDPKQEPARDSNGDVIWDPELKDKENVPYGMNVDEYMNKEVLPFASDAVVDQSVLDKGPLSDEKVGIVGTSISFNRYFYKYEKPVEPEVVAKEILELEEGLGDFIKEILK